MRLICLLLIFSFQTAQAGEDIFDLAARYNKKKQKVTELETLKRQTLSQLYKIEKETNRLELQKTESSEKELKLNVELKEISKKVVSIEQEILELTPILAERMALVDQVNNLPWFYTLITSQSITELDQMFSAAQRINNQQADQIGRFLSLLQELEAKKIKLKETATELILVKREIKEKENKIISNQESKKKALGRIERILASEKSRLKSLKGKGKRLVSQDEFKELSLLFGSEFFDKKGELPHPIDSPILHGFGLNRGLIEDHVQLVHKGNFYRSIADRPVKVVANGRVKKISNVSGLGKVVIVDHGGRYYTTYANLSATKIKLNQLIETGDVIGVTGNNHIQLGEGLYFEIRHFSQPQDPEKWLIKKKRNLATI